MHIKLFGLCKVHEFNSTLNGTSGKLVSIAYIYIVEYAGVNC